MKITAIDFKFMFFSSVSEHSFTVDIPLKYSGDEVITELSRCSFETKIEKYKMTADTANQFNALIDKYDLTARIGKASAPPEVNGEGFETSTLTFVMDDGSNSEINFREPDENEGREAAVELRKAVFDAIGKENLISSELRYPTLKECREIREVHGPVVAVEHSFFSMGMMYGSNQTTTRIVEKISDGRVRVTIKKKAGNEPEVSDSKEIDSDIFPKIQELSDKENLPSWEYACIDPDKPVDTSMMPMDYSSSSSVTIVYDDSGITGAPTVRRTIGDAACKMGGQEVFKTITKLIADDETKSGIEVAMPQPYIMAMMQQVTPKEPENKMPGFDGMNQALNTPAGPWTCKACGKADLTGKFCPECGNPRG